MPLLTAERRRLPLYVYQKAGVRRLLKAQRLLLADDMGLGKTIQVIVAAKRLLEQGRIRRLLVMAPTSLLRNWAIEFGRWAPEVCVRIAGASSARDAFESLWGKAHVMITNYEQNRKPFDAIVQKPPELLILDEAHRVKNWQSQVAAGVGRIEADWVWALTGTPLEKDELDVIGLMSLLMPSVFSSRDRDLAPWMLRAKIRPYVLRREKGDVLSDLPPIEYRMERVELLPRQRAAYARTAAEMGTTNNTLSVFSRLREICDYDRITRDSAKIDRAVEIIEDVCSRPNCKAVVFSYLLEPLRLLGLRLADVDVPVCGIYEGSLNAKQRQTLLDDFYSVKRGVLLASMRAAGEGLSLVDANHVLLINRWWNPSANKQAIDRVHRIGQRRAVTVYVLEATNTVEDRLAEMLAGKEGLFDEVVSRLRQYSELFRAN